MITLPLETAHFDLDFQFNLNFKINLSMSLFGAYFFLVKMSYDNF